MIYKWKDDAKRDYTKFSAQVVGEHLIKLSRQYGGNLTSVVILSDAKNVESPLHRMLEWDDGKAASAYRKVQAGEIGRSIVTVKVDTRSNSVQEVPLLSTVTVSHSDGREHGAYINSKESRQNPNFRRQTVQRGLQELARWYDRYSAMEEFNDLLDAVDEKWPEWGKDFAPATRSKVGA